jgi:prepilin-type N-terminal cleavage/methylation domain-containing protein
MMRHLRNPQGFTLAEVLVAAVIITLAFVALGRMVPLAGYGVQQGYQASTATFLADQKLELIKDVPWVSAPANDCLGVSASATAAPTVPATATCTFGVTTVNGGGALPWAADENSTAITNFSGYARQVRVTDCGSGAGCMGIVDAGMRLVTVIVSYTPMTGIGTATSATGYSVSMLISQQ